MTKYFCGKCGRKFESGDIDSADEPKRINVNADLIVFICEDCEKKLTLAD